MGPLLDEFVQNWAAHGHPLKAGWQLLHNQMLVLAVDEDHHAPSGCSIDTSVHLMRQLEAQLQTSLLDRAQVAVLATDAAGQPAVHMLPLASIKEAVAQGQLTPETPVANTALTQMQQVRNELWQPAGQTWLKRYFSAAEIKLHL